MQPYLGKAILGLKGYRPYGLYGLVIVLQWLLQIRPPKNFQKKGQIRQVF